MKVIAIAAISLDGMIARSAEDFVGWTSKADKQFFAGETKKAGVMILGHTTYESFGKPLPGRLHIVVTRRPDQFENKPGVVEFTNKEPKAIIEDLSSRGFDSVVIAGGSQIYTLFATSHLLTDLWLTIEPYFFHRGISLFADIVQANFSLQSVDRLGENEIAVKYKVGY